MCFEPTEERSARDEARRAAEAAARDERRDPSAYPEPRGNQEVDEREVERSRERLTAVLGH